MGLHFGMWKKSIGGDKAAGVGVVRRIRQNFNTVVWNIFSDPSIYFKALLLFHSGFKASFT